MIYGPQREWGIVLDGLTPRKVATSEVSANDLWIHDDRDRVKANILARFFGDPMAEGNFPRPFGVFYQAQRATHDDLINAQVSRAKEALGAGDLDKLLSGRNTWTIA
jgi:2-oxoglutarate ferredoxin oxidoreductase subunit beta